MKRGGPLQRRTPLRAKTGLARGAGPTRRTPVKPKRESVRRKWEEAKADARGDGHSIPWEDVRRIVYTRSGGRCEGCGKSLSFAAMQAHHRRTRAVGPDCPCNALALCSNCHHVKVHGQPEKARELGRIISRHDRNAASLHPVRLHHGLVLLDCKGGLAPASP